MAIDLSVDLTIESNFCDDERIRFQNDSISSKLGGIDSVLISINSSEGHDASINIDKSQLKYILDFLKTTYSIMDENNKEIVI